MNKVSVIIPTLWKAKEFTDHLVDVLVDDESVGEIIIIDNAPTDFCYTDEKVCTLKQSENVVSGAGSSILALCPAGTVTLADST